MKRERDSSDAEESFSRDVVEGSILHGIVNDGLLEGYEALLHLCETSNMLCPYFLDPALPVFKEVVLCVMDTERLQNVFRLFAEHCCGGRQFFNRMLRHFPFVDERVVDAFWSQTATLWRYEVDLPLLQQAAIVSTHPWLLRKLSSKWDTSRIPRGALHVVGNAEACQLLLRSGRFAVNNTQDWHGAGITPLHNVISKDVAACLLASRADVAQVLDCSNVLPRVRVIRWIFELCLANRVWNVLWLPTTFFAKQHKEPMLDVIGLLSEFHCAIPLDILHHVSLDDETKCALFTYGYMNSLPVGTRVDVMWLRWRPWTHRYFIALHDTIWCILLCWKRVFPALPRDVRNYILVLLLEDKKTR